MRPLSRNCQKKQHWCQTEPWQTSFGTPDGSPTSRLTSFGVHVWVPLNRDEPLKNLPFALLIALVSRWASLQQLGGETHDMSLILSIGCCLEFLANSSRPGRKVDTHTQVRGVRTSPVNIQSGTHTQLTPRPPRRVQQPPVSCISYRSEHKSLVLNRCHGQHPLAGRPSGEERMEQAQSISLEVESEPALAASAEFGRSPRKKKGGTSIVE